MPEEISQTTPPLEPETATANQQTTQEPQASPTPSVSSSVQKSQKNRLLFLIVPVIAVIILGIIAYFVVGIFTAPAKVKASASINQPLFLDLDRTNDKIATHITESPSGLDADSFAREGQKGQDYLNQAKKDSDQLTANAEKMSGPMSNYKSHLQKYLSESKELSGIEEQNVKLFKAYEDPIKQYQQMTVDLSGAATYIYTDPTKYLDALDSAIKSEDDIISQLKGISVTGVMKDQHEAFIKTLETEDAFLKEMGDAVQSKDSAAISSAQKTYAENSQTQTEENNRLSDQLKNQVSDITDSLKSEADSINEDYSQLRNKYNF